METQNAEFIPAGDEPGTEVIDFNVNDARIAEVAEEYKEVDAYQDIDGAKAAKKVLTKMRTTLAEAHKEQKAGALAYGRRLDAEKNRLLGLIGEIENPIKEQLDAIKNAEELKEVERKLKIENHIERLNSYAYDRHDLSIDQIKERRANLALETFEDERYQERINDAKMAAEEADTKLRIVLQREMDAEEERAAQAKIAEENAARQAELDKRQAEMDAKEAAIKAEQDERDRTAREEQAKKDAERQAELDKQAEELAAKQKAIDDAAAEEERKAREEEEREAELAKAPDRDKLELFAAHIQNLIDNKPVMGSQEGVNTMLFATSELKALVNTIFECVEKMK
jgi:hypothetical protein